MNISIVYIMYMVCPRTHGETYAYELLLRGFIGDRRTVRGPILLDY